VGFDWPADEGVLDKLAEEITEFKQSANSAGEIRRVRRYPLYAGEITRAGRESTSNRPCAKPTRSFTAASLIWKSYAADASWTYRK
jgi:hypothetical protein